MNAVAQRLSPEAPNAAWLRQIQHAQQAGDTCLPAQLGLERAAYTELYRRHQLAPASRELPARERDALRQELLVMRRDEWSELHDLLLSGRRDDSPEVHWMAAIVAAACLGGNHLWRDLGMTSRTQLRELLLHNFPQLALRNTQDMRWKKFFYKQLCEREGGYVCRSPSCDICPTYDDCFGEES